MRDYQASVEKISAVVYRFFDRTFTRFCIEGPRIDLPALRGARVMVPATHRSQADYFIVGRMLHGMGIQNMRFAAGDNLTGLPVIGRIYRALGAFTVKRHNTRRPSYVRDLCEQVAGMLVDGDTIVVFPEGGRSYEGGMMEMKSGIIGSAILAQAREPSAGVYYFPAAVSYECLPELVYFGMLRKGKQMRNPSHGLLRRLIGSVLYFGADLIAYARFLTAHRFGRNYGAVYVDYGEPVRVSSFIEKDEIDGGRPGRDEFFRFRGSMQAAALALYDRFLSLYRILPAHIVSSVLINTAARTPGELAPLCAEVAGMLRAKGRNMKTADAFAGVDLVREGVRQLGLVKAARMRGGRIDMQKPWIVRYYAATVDGE